MLMLGSRDGSLVNNPDCSFRVLRSVLSPYFRNFTTTYNLSSRDDSIPLPPALTGTHAHNMYTCIHTCTQMCKQTPIHTYIHTCIQAYIHVHIQLKILKILKYMLQMIKKLVCFSQHDVKRVLTRLWLLPLSAILTKGFS